MIHQLSQSMINKIAAGEVVERPASVVKEMMENSVDAGSTRIDVSVEKGGCDRIRIVDNGCGIAREDLLLALSPHATSKLEEADDLFRIKTFGFRGEALASIAEISQLSLRSRPASSDEGAEINSEGGVFSDIIPCGMPQGTVIDVCNLFFNTPVRRGYLRSTATEFGHILEAFVRIALPHSHIHFTLQHTQKLIHELPIETVPLERIRKLFGSEIADHLLFVESRRGSIAVSGYVGLPKISRSNNRMQYFFLNGRYIRDRALQHALSEAYRGLLTTGRFPIAFLQVEMSPEMFDVNVHPTKMEVRFLDSNKVYSHFLGTIREHFLTCDLASQLSTNDLSGAYLTRGPSDSPPSSSTPKPSSEHQSFSDFPQNDPRTSIDEATLEKRRQDVVNWVKGQLKSKQQEQAASDRSEKEDFDRIFEKSFVDSAPHFDMEHGTVTGPETRPSRMPLRLHPLDVETSPNSQTPSNKEKELKQFDQTVQAGQSNSVNSDPFIPSDHPEFAERDWSEIPRKKVMQAHDRYLIRETDSGIAIIDQHALHERLLYEKIKLKYNTGQLDSQRLLVPIPIDLVPTESACALENRALLQQLGLAIEPFGGDTVLISGYPSMLEKIDPQELLLNIIDMLLDFRKKPDRTDLLDGIFHSMACKAAVKAGQNLRDDAIEQLLASAEQEVNAHHCPHGRPSVLQFSCEELDKLFKRT